MRDAALISLIIGSCGIALIHPWVGVLAWTWISIMNPHNLAWAVATMPVAAVAAGSTLLGMMLTRDRLQFFLTRETALLIAFMVWVTISHLFSFSPEGGYPMWIKVMKIDFMILVTLVILHSKRHILLFVGVVVFSLGFYGIKGGIFTIVTGGNYKVWGPGGFIEGNNEMALALIVVIPLMRFLQLQTTHWWLRQGWTAAMVLTAAAAIGSHSRGALLAIVAMAAYVWFKSRGKLILGLVLVVVAVAFLAFMPAEWESRMESIADYEQDSSAMGRINAWGMAFNLAKARFTGGGFDIYNPEIFAMYASDPSIHLAAHSIYFQVLGEHGFPGLIIYLLLWWFVWRAAGGLISHRSETEQSAWCRDLGAMTQASLLGFAVGGAFLSLAYFDLPYDLLVMVVLARRWIEQKGWENKLSEEHRTGQEQKAGRAQISGPGR